MAGKKLKTKKKRKLTLSELKKKLSEYNSTVAKGKRIGFEMLKGRRTQVINLIEKQRRKEKKHKKDYKNDSE